MHTHVRVAFIQISYIGDPIVMPFKLSRESSYRFIVSAMGRYLSFLTPNNNKTVEYTPVEFRIIKVLYRQRRAAINSGSIVDDHHWSRSSSRGDKIKKVLQLRNLRRWCDFLCCPAADCPTTALTHYYKTVAGGHQYIRYQILCRIFA